MFPLHSLMSLLPAGGQALAAGLHPEILRAWLDTLPGMPPEAAAQALREQIERVGASGSLRARLKMLDLMAEATLRIVAHFEADLDKARHPLSAADRRKVVAGNDLLKHHARGYRDAIDRLQGGWRSRDDTLLLRRTLTRAMDMERRRLILAYRAYAAGSKSAWRNLHILYRAARAGGLAAAGATDGEESPHRLYVKTILLALAEPVQLAPGELDRVRFYLDRYARLAELQEAPRPPRDVDSREGCFLIRQNEEGPGRSLRKWGKTETHEGDLLLDCGPLLERLRSQIDGLEHGVLPSKIGLPSVAHRPEYLALLKHLIALWSAPPLRRFPRQHFKPRVELAAGLDDIWRLLSGAAHKRRREDPRRPDDGLHPVELSEWSVLNESPTGFALHYLSGESSALAVGTLVGLRAVERSQIHVCIVRRLVSGDGRCAELGLEKFAPRAVPTTIAWSGSAAGKPPARAIVLPEVPACGGSHAAIVAPHVLRPGKRVPYVLDGRKTTAIAGTPIARNAAFEIFSLGDPD